MTEYHCYFSTTLSPNDNRLGTASTVHILRLDSDEAARLTAEAICTECDHICGFQIWQGERLICTSSLDAAA